MIRNDFKRGPYPLEKLEGVMTLLRWQVEI